MIKTPFFSVVLPLYNSSATLARTLDSLCGQTFKDFELIIIDDYSKDLNRVNEILNLYKKKLKVKLFKHSENKNGAAARNTGIKNAKGCFVCFIDSDDTWDFERLEYLYDYIEKYNIKDDTIIYGKVRVIREGTSYIEYKPIKEYDKKIHLSEYLFCYGGIMQTSTLSLSRMSLTKLNFDERFTRHQDVTFNLEAYFKGFDFKYISRPLVNYIVPYAILKDRISDRRISLEFCNYWLECMSGKLTTKAIKGYDYYVKSRIQILSRLYISAFINIIKVFLTIDLLFIKSVIIDAIVRIKIILFKIK